MRAEGGMTGRPRSPEAHPHGAGGPEPARGAQEEGGDAGPA